MTIAALRALLDEELPDVHRHPAPRLPRQRFTAKETPVMPAAITQPAASVAEDAEKLPVGALLAWGDTHEDSEIQDQATRARIALAGLRKRYASDQELSALVSEEEELEKRLEELRARKGELVPSKPRRRVLALDYDAATVRAWAKLNGVECNDRGRVPGPVVDAWRAATGRQTASA